MTSSKTGKPPAKPAWATYEDEVADFFRSLGLKARTSVNVTGARGSHDVDVLVEFASAGIEITWVVECKAWKRAIPKERVLTLSGVVADLGADRGIMVAESGFQGGAIRVAQNANITLTSLEDLRANTEAERAQAEVSAFASRTAALAEDASRIWDWAPPSTRTSAIAVDDMVDLASAAFELNSLVLPKIAAARYPITLSIGGHFVAHDAAELKPVLLQRLASAEQRAEVFWTLIGSAAQRGRDLADAFSEALEELVAAGRTFDAELTGAAPPRFVPAMRAVSDAADALVPVVPARVRSGVVAVMRWLPDNAYSVTGDTRPDWDQVASSLQRFVVEIRADMTEAATRIAADAT